MTSSTVACVILFNWEDQRAYDVAEKERRDGTESPICFLVVWWDIAPVCSF
jgi:hypothetical protein